MDDNTPANPRICGGKLVLTSEIQTAEIVQEAAVQTSESPISNQSTEAAEMELDNTAETHG